MTTPTVAQSVLVYDRIAQNRRRTLLLVAVALLSIVPFIAVVSWGASDWLVLNFGPHTHLTQRDEQRAREVLDSLQGPAITEIQREMDQQFDRERRARILQDAANARFRWQAMIIVALALSGVLALLFWGLTSSPTSNVLSLCGARVAGPAEAEAARLLENLSIGAGLPLPRLYVIDTPTPNAFAAGMTPARSVVVVTSGLLSLLDRRELEGVLAHELSHIGNRDTRLNTLVSAIALFLRLPDLIRRRNKRERKQAGYNWNPQRRSRLRFRISWTLLPLYVYVFFVAPLIAAVMRAMISRTREYLADADGALLTRYPEGLLRALAKIAGAGSVVPGANPVISHLYIADPTAPGIGFGLFKGNLLATHPPIDQRIARLMEFAGGTVPASVVEVAVRAGRDFGRDHPALAAVGLTEAVSQDELSILTVGNPMGLVYRTLAPTPLYDGPNERSGVLQRIPPGALIIAFDDPGKYRQVVTHDQTFGYIPRAVKLERVDMLPTEVTDPAARARAEAAHVRAQAVAASQMGTPAPPVQAAATSKLGLTPNQMAIAAGVFVLVFAGLMLVLLTVGK